MRTCLLMGTYNRTDVLKTVLHQLLLQQNTIPMDIYIVDDCSTDPQTSRLLHEFSRLWNKWGMGKKCTLNLKGKNEGTAALFSDAMRHLFEIEEYDYVVCMDSDVVVSPDDWPSRLVSFLQAHPEVGYVAPDKPGSYLRLRRNGYDEVEWAVSICYATSRRAYLDIINRDDLPEGEWFDRQLGNAWDPDVCYRLRMLGYRVAIASDTVVTDLGEGKSTIKHNLARDNFGFNKKWNKRLLGRFIYKSPLMLRWDQYPLNVQFRLMVNAQQGTMTVDPSETQLSRHESERVSLLLCKGNHPRPEALLRLITEDVSIRHDQSFEDVDPDLLTGKRSYDPDRDLQGFSLKAKNG